ncbi:hypothetical protein [Alkalibacillus flavidus]|uniref:hypothetical protein n=1 Tax=Alkalibacillus flavidus TaxID=546021 RepID=UPI00366ED783
MLRNYPRLVHPFAIGLKITLALALIVLAIAILSGQTAFIELFLFGFVPLVGFLISQRLMPKGSVQIKQPKS